MEPMDHKDIYELALRELDIDGIKALVDLLLRHIKRITVERKDEECRQRLAELIPIAAELCGVSEERVLDEDRTHGLVICRQIIILKLYRDGHSIRSITKAIGLSRSTVLYAIDKMSEIVTSGSPTWKDVIQKYRQLKEI